MKHFLCVYSFSHTSANLWIRLEKTKILIQVRLYIISNAKKKTLFKNIFLDLIAEIAKKHICKNYLTANNTKYQGTLSDGTIYSYIN